MIKELREVWRESTAKEKYIRHLQDIGSIKKIISENGYVAYDTEEYDEYKRTVKRGRPIKKV